MLTTVRNAFKIKEVRNGLLFTFAMLLVIRLGSQIPLPGIDNIQFTAWFNATMGESFNFFNAMTGGSFENMSIFALNISPYITSSIIMQLMTIAIPKLEEMQKDGEEGKKKIQEITRYVTIALALIQAIAMAIGFSRSGTITDPGFLPIITVVLGLTAGSAFLMWVGEQITTRGVGNGISMVLVINIMSRIPSDLALLTNQFIIGQKLAWAILAAVIIIAVILATIVLVIVLQDAERRIPVQYSRKVVGRKQMGGQSTHIPLKVNTAGVIPVIFASSLMQFPMVIAAFFGKSTGEGFGYEILNTLNTSNWCNPEKPIYSIGLLIYIALIVFFAYFYTSITFNPLEVANNMKKNGGFVPGIRPGKTTADYLSSITKYIVVVGAIGLIIVSVIPIVFSGVFSANVSFLGTSLIIIVGVVLETIKQIESKMQVRYYKGFLND